MSKSFQTIYDDSDILVLNKPAGLIVESQKKSDITLEKILKEDFKIDLPRSGIVHRLDRDTSGVMVVARNEKALISLQNQFASHEVEKIYKALVYGEIKPQKGTINIALKRDSKNRIRFVSCRGTSRCAQAKEAITHYEVVETCCGMSFLKIKIYTGRTHQIRAHLYAIGFPIVGDSVYKSRDSEIFSKKIGLDRQFLHAEKLCFKHPKTGKKVCFEAKMPEELMLVLGYTQNF